MELEKSLWCYDEFPAVLSNWVTSSAHSSCSAVFTHAIEVIGFGDIIVWINWGNLKSNV